MGKAVLYLAVLSLCAALTLGCRCPPLTLEQYYQLSTTVVKASVLGVAPTPCPATGCLPGVERVTYTLAVTALFKGCAPLSLLFFAQTSASSSECGSKLGVGETWLLFLPEPEPLPPSSGPGDLFQINTCQGNRPVASLSDKDLLWLEDASTKPENICPADEDVASSPEIAAVETPTS